MSTAVTILGEHPLAKSGEGRLKSRIGTAFPRSNALVTLPGIHATQRQAFLDFLNHEREAAGQEPLSRHQEHVEWNNAVDLIMDDNTVQIRPDPGNMALAFEADDLLQELVPKHRIKFLGVLNEKVRDAIKERGEWWRITLLPKSLDEMKQMILASRIALGGKEIYYYSRTTGIHFLTCQLFSGLGQLDDAALCDQ
jgi:hypothetical protein